jgi:hypothetical protein
MRLLVFLGFSSRLKFKVFISHECVFHMLQVQSFEIFVQSFEIVAPPSPSEIFVQSFDL